MAAIRSQVLYIAKYIVRQLAIGSYLAADVAANATTFRVMSPGIFDPSGGTLIKLDDDTVVTYTGMSSDQLTGASGVPAMAGFANTTEQDVVMITGLVDPEELEVSIDAHRTWHVEEMFEDVDDKKWNANLGWYDTDVVVRDDDDDSYNTVSIGGSDTIDYRRGEVTFNSARSESVLYLAGWRYNPFYTIADLISQHGNQFGEASWIQVGQQAQGKMNDFDIAAYWRGRGWAYAL